MVGARFLPSWLASVLSAVTSVDVSSYFPFPLAAVFFNCDLCCGCCRSLFFSRDLSCGGRSFSPFFASVLSCDLEELLFSFPFGCCFLQSRSLLCLVSIILFSAFALISDLGCKLLRWALVLSLLGFCSLSCDPVISVEVGA